LFKFSINIALQLHPIKLSTCNLHGTNTRAGITARVEHISLTQFISSSALKHDSSQSDLWLESGGLTIGPIDAEAAMALPNPDFHKIQDNFLKIHDKKTKRLWFVWPPEEVRVLPICDQTFQQTTLNFHIDIRGGNFARSKHS